MIVKVNSRDKHKFRKAIDHVNSKYNRGAGAADTLWLEEFNIKLLYDETKTGIVAFEFLDEKHYMLWLLKWS